MKQRETQYTRIIKLFSDYDWHCVSEFHPITWYPWKRRAEIEEKGVYKFKQRKCEHGIPGADDWIMERVVSNYRQDYLDKQNQPSLL